MSSRDAMQFYRVNGMIPALIIPPEIVIYNPAYSADPFTVQARLGPGALDLRRLVQCGLLTPFASPGRPGARHLHLVEG